MYIEKVTDKTLGEFLRCLQDKNEEDPRQTELRRLWYAEHSSKGLYAGLLKSKNGSSIGLYQTIPIEYSPLAGQQLTAILCLWIYGYDRGVGKQQGKGWGRFLLEAIEEEARRAGAKGVAAWGMDWQINWMPAAFFRHMGYKQTDSEDKVKVFWKPFSGAAQPPKLKRLSTRPIPSKKKVNVTVAANGWCLGCYKFLHARDAIKGLEHMVEYNEVEPVAEANILHLGRVGGIFLDGEVFQPYEICTPETVREKIKQMYQKKAGGI